MRLAAYLIMMLLFSTATAQNPTILQGNYISNVFGQSNFVINPNAQTGIGNISNSNATITRSTTTPLVATTEFNWNASVGGFSTWSLRPLDEGMKNQNCEARFTYRGFTAGTTTAQIRHSGNVIAELVLTPSATDPRTASINFPCGDLSLSTNFRLLQSGAILGGINEIGGIYVGLATNMANIAQAEVVVRATRTIAQSIPNNTPTTIAYNSTALDVLGEFNTSTGVYTAKRAGRYLIDAFFMYDIASWTAGNIANISIWKNGGQVHEIYNTVQVTGTIYVSSQINYTVELDVGDTILIATYQTSGAVRNLIANATYHGLSISRFPSSSELVVTPETQNVWAGVVYTSGDQQLHNNIAPATAYSSYNNAMWNQPTMLKGRASVTTTNSGNDLGFSVANLPVGQYKLELSGLVNAYNANSATAGTLVRCNFRLIETTTSTTIASQSHQDQSYSNAAPDESRDYINSFFGTFNNTAVATRNFRLEAQKVSDDSAGTIGRCQAYANNVSNQLNTYISMLLTPLDNKSNSALYVQGPVKAAGTGTAIPSGYVGEEIKNASSVTSVSTSTANNPVDVGNATITLTPGVWDLQYTASLGIERGGWANTVTASVKVTDSANNVESGTESAIWMANAQAVVAGIYSQQTITKRIYLTSPKTFKLRLWCSESSGVAICYVANGNITGGISGNEATTYIRAVRIN